MGLPAMQEGSHFEKKIASFYKSLNLEVENVGVMETLLWMQRTVRNTKVARINICRQNHVCLFFKLILLPF